MHGLPDSPCIFPASDWFNGVLPSQHIGISTSKWLLSANFRFT